MDEFFADLKRYQEQHPWLTPGVYADMRAAVALERIAGALENLEPATITGLKAGVLSTEDVERISASVGEIRPVTTSLGPETGRGQSGTVIPQFNSTLRGKRK